MAQKQLTVERRLYNELEQDFHQSLSVEQALLHLNNERTTTRLPFRPKPGNLYLFSNPTRPDDWRADGHKWVNQGTTKLPRSTKLIKKTYFYIASENGYDKRFRKEVFMRNEEGSPVLIHYIGDDSISKPAPHGNCLKQTKLFFRTKPSAIREFESKVQKEQAHKVYKEEISKQTDRDEILSRPRNVKQLQNLKSKLSGQSRLSRDAILNTHTIAYEEPNFVWKLTTVPDLLVICGMEAMLDELKQLLKKPNPSQMLSYDTTFCLGDFYVSPLLFRHTMFEENPVMPVLFMFHERQYQEHHEELFKTMNKFLTKTQQGRASIVTDSEAGIVGAVESQTNFTHLFCWRHLFKDIHDWIDKHLGTREDRKVMGDELAWLFQRDSKEGS